MALVGYGGVTVAVQILTYLDDRSYKKDKRSCLLILFVEMAASSIATVSRTPHNAANMDALTFSQIAANYSAVVASVAAVATVWLTVRLSKDGAIKISQFSASNKNGSKKELEYRISDEGGSKKRPQVFLEEYQKKPAVLALPNN